VRDELIVDEECSDELAKNHITKWRCLWWKTILTMIK